MRTPLLARFAEIVGPADASLVPWDGALACAACLQDGACWEGLGDALRQLERGASQRCGPLPPEAGVQALLCFLEDEGFTGPPSGVVSAGHHLLDRVIETRCGSSTALCILVAHLAARSDVDLQIVDFPGHSLIAADLNRDVPILFDPCGPAAPLTMTALADLHAEVKGRPVGTHAPDLRAALAPAHPRLLLTDLVYRLRRAYTAAGNHQRMTDTMELLSLMQPDLDLLQRRAAEERRRQQALN